MQFFVHINLRISIFQSVHSFMLSEVTTVREAGEAD